MPTLSRFLMDRLAPLTKHVFGIPGDYILNFYDQLSKNFDVCNTTDEQCAGFAADAYARVNGFGVVCATYCVGGFKLLNAVAGAYAEKSPLLVISGAPGVKERQSGLLLHHCAGAYECQHQVFKNVTCASAVLNDPVWAAHEIDRVIEAIQYHKQPGYIEIPRDMVDRNVRYDVYTQGTPDALVGDKEALAEAIAKSIEWLKSSSNPVIIAGVEVSRYRLGDVLMRFAERNNIPIATTILGKSVVNEYHPLSLGVYAGKISRPEVREIVDRADCVLQIGALQTDMNTGFQPFQWDSANVIMANSGRLKLRKSSYEQVPFVNYVEELCKVDLRRTTKVSLPPKTQAKFTAKQQTRITSARLFEKINSVLDKNIAVIADVGDSLFGAAELTMHQSNHFLSPAFYTSMGNSVPGALGVQLALPNVRPIVIVGDGAFQMTGMEFSTIVRRKLNPIIFVLNNDGYGTERLLGFDGPYNDVQPWQFHKVPEIVGGGIGYCVETEEQLDQVVAEAFANKKVASVINVVIDRNDVTPALKRMTGNLSKQV